MDTIDERITAAGRAQRIAYAEVGTTDPGIVEAGIIETVGEVATAAGVTGHWNQETDTWTSDATTRNIVARVVAELGDLLPEGLVALASDASVGLAALSEAAGCEQRMASRRTAHEGAGDGPLWAAWAVEVAAQGRHGLAVQYVCDALTASLRKDILLLEQEIDDKGWTVPAHGDGPVVESARDRLHAMQGARDRIRREVTTRLAPTR